MNNPEKQAAMTEVIAEPEVGVVPQIAIHPGLSGLLASPLGKRIATLHPGRPGVVFDGDYCYATNGKVALRVSGQTENDYSDKFAVELSKPTIDVFRGMKAVGTGRIEGTGIWARLAHPSNTGIEVFPNGGPDVERVFRECPDPDTGTTFDVTRLIDILAAMKKLGSKEVRVHLGKTVKDQARLEGTGIPPSTSSGWDAVTAIIMPMVVKH